MSDKNQNDAASDFENENTTQEEPVKATKVAKAKKEKATEASDGKALVLEGLKQKFVEGTRVTVVLDGEKQKGTVAKHTALASKGKATVKFDNGESDHVMFKDMTKLVAKEKPVTGKTMAQKVAVKAASKKVGTSKSKPAAKTEKVAAPVKVKKAPAKKVAVDPVKAERARLLAQVKELTSQVKSLSKKADLVGDGRVNARMKFVLTASRQAPEFFDNVRTAKAAAKKLVKAGVKAVKLNQVAATSVEI